MYLLDFIRCSSIHGDSSLSRVVDAFEWQHFSEKSSEYDEHAKFNEICYLDPWHTCLYIKNCQSAGNLPGTSEN